MSNTSGGEPRYTRREMLSGLPIRHRLEVNTPPSSPGASTSDTPETDNPTTGGTESMGPYDELPGGWDNPYFFGNDMSRLGRQAIARAENGWLHLSALAELQEVREPSIARPGSLLQPSDQFLHPEGPVYPEQPVAEYINSHPGVLENATLRLWLDGLIDCPDISENDIQATIQSLAGLVAEIKKQTTLIPELTLPQLGSETTGQTVFGTETAVALSLLIWFVKKNPFFVDKLVINRPGADPDLSPEHWAVPKIGVSEDGKEIYEDKTLHKAARRWGMFKAELRHPETGKKFLESLQSMSFEAGKYALGGVFVNFIDWIRYVFTGNRGGSARAQYSGRSIYSSPPSYYGYSAPNYGWGGESSYSPRGRYSGPSITRRVFLTLLGAGGVATAGALTGVGFASVAPAKAVELFPGLASQLAYSSFADILDQLRLERSKQANGTSKVDIMDRDGQQVHSVNEHLLTRSEDLPDSFIQLLAGMEDAGFYGHRGVTAKGVLRGIKDGTGTSTITMQVVEQMLRRAWGAQKYDQLVAKEGAQQMKIAEIVLATMLEELLYQSHKTSDISETDARLAVKKEILTLYCNLVTFGTSEEARGLRGALKFYTGQSTMTKAPDGTGHNLNEKEQLVFAMLANIPSLLTQGPNEIDDWINFRINGLVTERILTLEQANAIRFQTLEHILPEEKRVHPYFVAPANESVRDYLAYADQLTRSSATKVAGVPSPDSSGLGMRLADITGQVELSMDQQLQAKCFEIKQRVEAADPNQTVSIMVRDPRSGEVLAFVGRFTDIPSGSTVKPFMYHRLLEQFGNSYSADTLLGDDEFDVILNRNDGNPPEEWLVTNDQNIELGTLPLGAALSQSGNRYAAWLELRRMGAIGLNAEFDRFGLLDNPTSDLGDDKGQSGVATANALGITTTIGRLCAAYSALCNDGKFVPQQIIRRVVQREKEIYKAIPHEQAIASEESADAIVAILSDPNNVPPVPAWEPFTDQSVLHCLKTGTSESGPDGQTALCVGGTLENSGRDVTVAVVVHSTQPHSVSGLAQAAPLMLEVMKYRMGVSD